MQVNFILLQSLIPLLQVKFILKPVNFTRLQVRHTFTSQIHPFASLHVNKSIFRKIIIQINIILIFLIGFLILIGIGPYSTSASQLHSYACQFYPLASQRHIFLVKFTHLHDNFTLCKPISFFVSQIPVMQVNSLFGS